MREIHTEEKTIEDLVGDLEGKLFKIQSLVVVAKEYSWVYAGEGFDIKGEDAHDALNHIYNSLDVISDRVQATLEIIDNDIRSKCKTTV